LIIRNRRQSCEQSSISMGFNASIRRNMSASVMPIRDSGPISMPTLPKPRGNALIAAATSDTPSSSGRGDGHVVKSPIQDESRQASSAPWGNTAIGDAVRGMMT
jgi:hypothetical protein